MKTKRILSLIIAVLMIMGTMASVSAEGTVVAKIGDIEYTSLSAAFANAEAGSTITLCADVELTAGITFNTNSEITLDGDGYSIKPANADKLGYQAVYLTGGKDAVINIEDITFEDFVKSNVTAPVLRLEGAKQFNLADVTFENCDVSNSAGTESSVVRIYDTNFKADNLTVNNCKGGMLFDIGPSSDDFDGQIVFENCNFTNNIALGTALLYTTLKGAEENFLSMSNCNFTGNVIGDATAAAPNGRGVVHLGSNSYFDGCTFDGNAVYGSHANNVNYGINEYSGYNHKFTNNVVKNSAAYQTNAKIGPVSGLAFMAVGALELEGNVVEANNEFYNRSTADDEYTEYPARSVGSYSDSYGKTTIISGTYNGDLAVYSGTASMEVKGGTFSTDVSAYVAEGLKLVENADGTYGVEEANAYVAKVGDTYYTTLAEAMGKFNGRTVEVLCDVAESIEGFWGVNLITNVPGGVTITNTNVDDWIDFDDVTVGAGVTVDVEYPFSGDSENVILGTLIAGETYYHGYNAKTTIKDGGKVIVEGTTILRYNKNSDAGIYVYGDGDDSTVEFDCGYYVGFYSGAFFAKDANVEAGYYLLKNSYDSDAYSDAYLTLDNSSIVVTGTSDGQDSFIIDDKASIVLKNGSSIEDVRDFNILAGTALTFTADSASTISATYMNIAEGVPFEKKTNADGTVGFQPAIDADLCISTAEELLAFAESVNSGNDYAGKTVVLMNDIDLLGDYYGEEDVVFNMVPIGTSANPFRGTFDGRGYTISELYLGTYADDGYTFAGDCVGLFGKMVDGTIKNVTVNNPYIVGKSYVAAIVGLGHTGTIENCHVTGEIDIEGYYMVGGISGQGYADISDCSVIGDADWDYNLICATYLESDLEGDKVGGIIGHQGEGSSIINCTVSNVTVEGTRNVAGIVGCGFESSDYIDCTIEDVTIGTNASAEYANSKKDSMCIGGIVGIYSKGDFAGGSLKNATIINVTFTNENGVAVSAGAVTGGHRGASSSEAPFVPTDITTENIEVTNVSGATNTYLEPVVYEWMSDTDAGYYMVDSTKLGLMRFLFSVGVNAEDVTESGIKYIKSADITEDVAGAPGVDGTSNAFYGDITGIPYGTTGNYLAIAYVKTAAGTFWSDVLTCSPNFTQYFTEYTAQ